MSFLRAYDAMVTQPQPERPKGPTSAMRSRVYAPSTRAVTQTSTWTSASSTSTATRTSLGLRGGRDIWLISESGLYKLVMRSDKPQVQAFQNWVAKVVLPTIRKTGSYSVRKVGQNDPLSLPHRRADRTLSPLPPCPAYVA